MHTENTRSAALPIVLGDIQLPPKDKLKIVQTNDLGDVMKQVTARSLGYNGLHLFGMAFVQGNRLCFTTSVPFRTLLEIARPERAVKGKQGLVDMQAVSNRPKEAPHGKRIREYLLSTACVGEKFILPPFTLNYGIASNNHEGQAPAVLMLFVPDDATLCWAAMLFLPTSNNVLEVTDGAHRWGEIEEIAIRARQVTADQRNALLNNAAAMTIVFETHRASAHQDFADCGKAKAIQQALVVTWDIRDHANARSVSLTEHTPFLADYVDCTASNVNLSARSRLIWSMSAIKMFVNAVVYNHPDRPANDEDLTADQKADLVGTFTKGIGGTDTGLEEFFTELVQHMPVFKSLEAVRQQKNPEVTVGSLRDLWGGNLALRGVAMPIFARAYCYCVRHRVPYADMAQQLGSLDWHLLTVADRSLVPPLGETYSSYYDALMSVVRPMWHPLVVVGDQRYRVNTSATEVDTAWRLMMATMYPESEAAMAAE